MAIVRRHTGQSGPEQRHAAASTTTISARAHYEPRFIHVCAKASPPRATHPPFPGVVAEQRESGRKEKKTRKAARRSAGSAGALGKADAFLENNKNRRRKRRVSPPSPPRRSRMDSTEDGLFQVCSRAVALAP